jgi:hypothetical protein
LVCSYNHLTCKGHIDFLLHKLNTVCFLMRKLYYILNTNNLKAVSYHSLVKYGIICWGNTSDSYKVFVIQKKIIRIMMGVSPNHTRRGLFKKLAILQIPCVYLLSLMTFVVNNFDKFRTNNSVYMINTRRNNHLHLPITHVGTSHSESSTSQSQASNQPMLSNGCLPSIHCGMFPHAFIILPERCVVLRC